MGEEACSWDLKDNIRSVILDWRQRSAGCLSEWGGSLSSEWGGSLSSEGRDLRVIQANMSCVFSGRLTTSQKGSPPQKNDMCKLSLTVFLPHTIVAVEEWKYKIYFYIFTSFSLFVQRFDMRQIKQLLSHFFSYVRLTIVHFRWNFK